MSYESKIFGVIPYEIRDSNSPIYSENKIESCLVEHYISEQNVLNDVVSIFHDDKHEGNIVTINTKFEDGMFWFDGIGFRFIASEAKQNSNIVKLTCKELGLTYKELGEAIGYGEGAIKNSASSGKVSETMVKAIELLLKIKEQEEELKTLNNLKNIIKDLIK